MGIRPAPWDGRPRGPGRLTGISRALGRYMERHGSARDWVWPNLPPAWVHHLKKNGEFGMGNGAVTRRTGMWVQVRLVLVALRATVV